MAKITAEYNKKAIETMGNLFNNKYNTSTNLIQANFAKGNENV
jgi:hypothetical protein